MEALTSPFHLTPQYSTISNRHQTQIPSSPKPIFPHNLSWTSSHNLRVSPTFQTKLTFEVSAITSPTVSSDPTSPYTPDVETQRDEDGEKFDWFSQWYPIAAEYDLDKKVPHARKVMGLDVVVWWDRNEEKWQVFDDSCPHRLAPLSEGRIDQKGRLQCVYHGWCFNGSGDCKLIPQAPADGPPVHAFKRACAAVYPCVLQNKIVWFWARSDPQYKDIATKETPPYVPELDDPSYASLLMSRDFPFGYELLTENLMDPAHVPYAHYGIQRPSTRPREKVDREGGMPLEINVTKLDKSGFFGKKESSFIEFVAPSLFWYYPQLVLEDGSSTSGSIQNKTTNKRILLVFFCTPVGPGKSRLLFSFPRNFAVWVDQVIPRWILHIRSNLVLDSDLYLLHKEERKLIAAGFSNWQKVCFVPTKSDRSVIAFRKWLKKYSSNQINWGPKFGAELFPTPPKEQLMDRYWSHVVNCSSCSKAVNGLKALEVVLQVISVASIGIVAVRQNVMSATANKSVVFFSVLGFAVSKWLAHFIYKTFYFHDYNHALK